MDWQRTVTNLLAKAEDAAATPEERQALTERAAYLMAKYGIERLLDRPTDAPMNVITVEMSLGTSHHKVRAILITQLARAFGCRTVRFVKTRKIRVYGLPDDIEQFTQLYVSLWIQANYALLASTKPEGVHGKTHNHSYLLGFVNEVSARVEAATRKASTDSEVSTALVFANRASAVDTAVTNEFPTLRYATPSRANSSESYGAGSRAGRSADINQPRMGGSYTARRALS